MKPARLFRNIVLCILGLVILLLVTLQILLRPKVLTRVVNRLAAEYVDGDLVFENVRASVIKDFPFLNITLENGALTYPHDRYAQYDSTLVEKGRFPLLQAGRGPEKDTLASFRRLSASVNYVNLLKKTSYDIRRVELERPRIFAHYYDSTAANWDILPLGTSSDTASQAPPLRIHRLHLTDRPFVVFTDQQDTVLGLVTMKHLLAEGRLDTHDLPGSDLKVLTDSMFLNGRLPSDTLAVRLAHLEAEAKDRRMTLSADADAFLSTRATGRMRLPVHIDTDTSFPERADGDLEALVHCLGLKVSTIGLTGFGDVVFHRDSTDIRADAAIEECPLGELLETFRDNFPVLRKIRTDAVLDLNAHCEGTLSKGRLPRLRAHLEIPDSYLDYEGLGRRGRISLDVDAATDEQLKLDLDLNQVLIDIIGAQLDISGTAADVTGDDPFFALDGKVSARVDSLTRAFTQEYGITGTGSVQADIHAQTRLSQLTLSRIGNADIHGRASIRDLSVDDAKDRIRGFVQKADILLETKGNRIDDNMRRGARVLALEATLDTLDATYKGGTYVRGKDIILQAQNSAAILKGGKELTPLMGILKAANLSLRDEDGLAVGLRDNTETFRVTPSTKDFRSPKLNLTSESVGVRLRKGAEGTLLRNFKFDITANKHQGAARDTDRRERMLDSLQRVWPGVPRDSLLIRYRQDRRRPLPSWMQEADFRKKDIRISLSDALRQYYRDWDFTGNLSLDRGIALLPSFPLRTEVTNLHGSLTNDRIDLRSVTVKAGSSDLSAQGSLSNLRRVLLGRGTLELDAALTSDFLDANELLRAYGYWQDYTPPPSMERASDEALQEVIDQAELPDSTLAQLLVIPANLNANVSLEAGGVRYDSLDVSWLAADIAMRQRTLQITNALAATNMGDIFFEGFYTSRSKQDIMAGFDLKLADVTAEKVITLFPAVDTLVPMLKSFAGDLNCELAATADVDTNMHLILPSIDGIIRISGKDLSISDESQEFKKIARYLMFRNKGGANVDRMEIGGMVRDNVLEVFPFVLDVDRYILAASGFQHLDESFNYHLSSIKSPLIIKFGVNVWGEDFDHVKYGLARAKYRSVNVPVFTKQLDTVQYSLLASIHNIFELGADQAVAENNAQRYIRDRMDETGYVSGVDTLAAPQTVTDSLQLMSERFDAAAEKPDREVLKEEVLELEEKSAAVPPPAEAKKEEDDE